MNYYTLSVMNGLYSAWSAVGAGTYYKENHTTERRTVRLRVTLTLFMGVQCSSMLVDASSKLPSGVLDGHIMDLGSYDQCLSVEAPGKIFVGQMCVVEARGFFPDTIDKFNAERPFMQPLREDLLFSVCVPSSCTAQDVSAHLNIALNSVNASAIVYDSSCSSNIPVPLKANDWIAILSIAAVILLVILSTAYENSSLGSDLLEGFAGEDRSVVRHHHIWVSVASGWIIEYSKVDD
ncbi:hypothetical protein J6590_041537 [Homalodisca vitripennis]|nr:hypothetical protein J6590_041537 [Homalodisca vitripennis]